MKIKKLIVAAAALLIMSGCTTEKVGYFQDVQSGEVIQMQPARVVKAQPGDKLSILVSSKNPQLAYLYNLPIVGHYETSTSSATLGNSRIASYKVDENGDIQFPILGKLHIADMTRAEIAETIRTQLVTQDLLKDATVTVDFLDLYFSVMGEVKTPGRFLIDHDKTTLLDALSRAGDLTIYGKRDNVLVMREENGKQMSYRSDLSNAASLYNSPAFYLKQEDIVYVEPNERRAREATPLGNSLANPSLWVSVASFTMSLAVLIFK